MITILHGNNIVASRKALETQINQAKARGVKETIRLNGKKIELTDLKQALETRSLFGQEKLVVIENLLSLPASSQKKVLVKYLTNINFEINLILWEEKLLTASQLSSLKAAKAQSFKISPKIFKFLDSIAPKNTKIMLTLLKEAKKLDSQEMIFYMLTRRISSLIIASDLGAKGLTSMQSWQKTRLLQQAKKFSLSNLIEFYNKLFDLDLQFKTGRNILPLSSQLDLIIADI
jgi:DNA polymerase III delta subunit